jgi:hypothetical protein
VALDATIGGAASNSYLTLEAAGAYFGQRLHASAWTSASEADREKALLMACRRIEACRIRVHRRPYGYPGAPAEGLPYDPLAPYLQTQALSFPRRKDRDSAGAWIIPQAAKDAQCEEALALLARGAEQEKRRALQAAGVTSFSVDGLSETYGAGAGQHALESSEARALLAPYVDRGGIIAASDLPEGEWSPGSG